MTSLVSWLRIGGSRNVAMVASRMPGLGVGAHRQANAHVNSMRQRDLGKRVAIVLILLWALPGSTSVLADEIRAEEKLAVENRQLVESVNEQGHTTTLLDGKRLFFNHDQRLSSKSKTDILPDSLSSDSRFKEVETGSRPVASVEQQKPIVVTESVVRREEIHYHARIEGWGVIRVIVNGLPCEAVNHSDLATAARGIALECKAMIAAHLQLQLLADGASIQIMDGRRVKGIITPGGSL